MLKFLPMTTIQGCLALKTLNKYKKHCFLYLYLSTFQLFLANPTWAENTTSISGVPKEIEAVIRKNITPPEIEKQNNALSLSEVKLFTEKEKTQIQNTLHALGYYHSKISSKISPGEKNQWHIYYDISINDPIVLSNVNIKIIGPGKNNPNILKAQENFTLKTGDILKHEAYTQNKNELLTSVIHNGYLDAYFVTHEILVDLQKKQARINLILDTLAPYTIGKINFSGANLHPDFLKRFAKFYEGEPYSPEKVLAFQLTLQQSDYFKSAQVEPIPNIQNRQVPLDVVLSPLKPNKYTLGLGYGSDTGVRATLGWERRYVNQWGHRFMMNLRSGEKNRSHEANVDYIIPGKFPITDYYKLHTGLHHARYLNTHSSVKELGLSQNRQMGTWQRVLTLAYREERFEQYDTTLGRHDALFLPSLQLIKIVSDDLFSPNTGHRFAFNLKAAISALLSDATFFQPKIDYKYLKKLTPDLKLILKTELGMTMPGDINRLPLSQRFYAGGDQSLRGFSYRSLPGNLDKKGQNRAIGGGYLAIGSLELEHKIYGPVSLALFSDAGNAFQDSHDKVQVSMGGGLRVQTPIGPIKIDLAKPLTEPHHHWRVHLQIGPEL